MGDDAQGVLVLDTSLNPRDTVHVFGEKSSRISKPVKPDIESSDIVGNSLWMLGSAAVSPYRDSLYKLDLETNSVDKIQLKTFFDRLRKDIQQLNIEAFAKLKDEIVLGHRRSVTHKQNYFIATGPDFAAQQNSNYKIIPFHPQNKDAGISGFAYSAAQDMLFITCSQEDTRNSYEDGEIGESYLAVIENVSEALKADTLSASHWLPLQQLHPGFSKVKVESVTIAEPKKDSLILYLAADNDDGRTRLYRIKLTPQY